MLKNMAMGLGFGGLLKKAKNIVSNRLNDKAARLMSGDKSVLPEPKFSKNTDNIVPLPKASKVDDVSKKTAKGGRGSSISIDEHKIVGKYSGRPFNPNKAGGEIKNLDWKNAKIDKEGIENVKKHLDRFGDDEANQIMIQRLERIEQGQIEITDYDKRFYTHELRELERFRELGIPDGEKGTFDDWNNAHTATLEDYKINERVEELYHPDANLD